MKCGRYLALLPTRGGGDCGTASLQQGAPMWILLRG